MNCLQKCYRLRLWNDSIVAIFEMIKLMGHTEINLIGSFPDNRIRSLQLYNCRNFAIFLLYTDLHRRSDFISL